jgi:hypothetical protein
MSVTRSFAARVGLAALALTAGLSTRGGATEQTLRWKLKPGDTLRYEYRQRCGIKVKGADGPASDDSSELTIDLTWTVKGVAPDGTAEIALVVDRVRSEARTGAQKVHYDSNEKTGDDPEAQALKAVYVAAVGERYTLKVDDRGRVVEAAVPAKVTEALRGSTFLATADGGSVLSAQGLKNLFAQLIPVLPEKAVDKGAAWSSSLDLPAPPMRLSLTYKDALVALEETAARVDATIVTAIRPDPDSPFKVAVKNQSGNRIVTIDTRMGRVTGSTVKQSVELRLVFMNREVGQVITLDERLRLVP